MNRLFFSILFCLFVLAGNAQSKLFTTRDSLTMFCDKVMKTFTESKFSQAIQMFRQKSVLDSSTINNIDKTFNDQMAGLLPYYGKLTEYEFLEERPIKNTISRRRYLLKFENYFLTVDFIMYNSRLGWTISNFNYYDNPKELF